MNKIRDATQKEILDSIQSPCHGLLNLAPRVGKTFISLQLLKREKAGKILWVTPSTQLRDVDIPNEFIKWKCKSLLNKTNIVCYKSLAEHVGNYDVVILDESLSN
jgi:predicted helicase